MKENFSVIWRNTGHWDIYTKDGRDYCIRGSKGKYIIRETQMEFKTVDACMAYICSELMTETE